MPKIFIGAWRQLSVSHPKRREFCSAGGPGLGASSNHSGTNFECGLLYGKRRIANRFAIISYELPIA